MAQVSLSRRVDALSDFKLYEHAENIRICTDYLDAEQSELVQRIGETSLDYILTLDERHAMENIIIGAVDAGAYELTEA